MSVKWSICVATAWVMATAVVGCSSDETSTTPSGGTSSSSSSSSSGATPGSSSSSSGSPSTGTPSASGTLYDRLGKKDGIAAALHAIVDKELEDTEIATYFFFQVQNPIPKGHPSRAQIEECLTLQLSNAAGGPETYPATVAGGFTCRDMKTAHMGLSIPAGVFDRFITIAAGVLKGAKVADADIKVIGSVLTGEKDNVAQDKTRETGPFMPPQGDGQ